MLKSQRNTYILFLLGLVLLFIVAAIYSALAWRNAYFFGKVTNVSQTNFVIENKVTGTRTIDITKETHIAKGKNRIQMPSVGEEVIIAGKKEPNGNIEAKSVRVVRRELRSK